ncbi:MAG: hypothetical protein AMXMBFR82_13120 [Candidatus Hydrogenedentota bacterium]
MITAVDTSVLIDIFRADERYGLQSAQAIRRSSKHGRLVVCDVVWAELTALFSTRQALYDQMVSMRIDFLPVDRNAATLAGELWGQYRARGGDRKRVIADFLIAAHAKVQCDRLLTRDRRFRRDYFGDVAIVDPMADAEDASS